MWRWMSFALPTDRPSWRAAVAPSGGPCVVGLETGNGLSDQQARILRRIVADVNLMSWFVAPVRRGSNDSIDQVVATEWRRRFDVMCRRA